MLEGLFDRLFSVKTNDDDKTSVEKYEKLKGSLFAKVIIDDKNKQFIIKGINFNKFIDRIKEMYKYKGIENLFIKRYSDWQEELWNKEKITRSEMKIISLNVPLFFALEMYKIFKDLGDFYNLPYYEKTARLIYEKTWISNFEKITPHKTNTKNLANIVYTLKDYQIKFIEKYTTLKELYSLEGYILSFEQGLGKTLTAVGLAECLNKEQIIIVCPNSLKENWALEIKSYFEKYTLDIDLFKHDVYVHNNSKYNSSKNPKYIIVNQENISAIFNIVDKYKDTIIIVDECHNFRNPEADRVKNLIKLKEITKCNDNLLMSGTPIKATPNEIIPMLIMIDPYFNDEMAEIYRKSFNKYSAEISSVVRERFSRVIYRKTKSEVLKLPEKIIQQIRLPIKSNESQYYIETVRSKIIEDFYKIYKELYDEYKPIADRFSELVLQYSSDTKSNTKEYLNYINHKIDVDKNNISVHEKRQEMYNKYLKTYVYPNINNPNDLKELKACAAKYVFMENSAMGKAVGMYLPPARTNCYIDILDSNIDWFIDKIKKNTKKTVIFSPYLPVAMHASEILTKNKINNVLIVGATKNRMDLITKFKEDDETDVLIATTQTLSTGVTLIEANQMIFLGTPYREADFEQACDRIHRIGQSMDVYIYTILLKSAKKNISDRVKEIMDWSGEASGEFMDIKWIQK